MGIWGKKKNGLIRPVAPPAPVVRTPRPETTTPLGPALSFQPGTNPAALPSKGPPTSSWVHRAGKANIGEFVISGGYFYIGTELSAIDNYRGTEPALVDPTLPIDFSKTDWSGEGLNYWPTYHHLSAGERAAYVSWLASPRDSPSTPIGFVFLYFYGLERRAFIDLSPLKDSHDQLVEIANEVTRLRSIYSHSSSFSSYSSDFLAILEFLIGPNDVPNGPPPHVDGRFRSFQPLLKFGLGRFAHEGLPIPNDWALAWAKLMPYSRLHRSNCPDELEKLFAIRYREHFGDGIVLKPVNTKVSVTYRPASASFGGEFEFDQDVPDVTLLTVQAQEIESIAVQCRDELSAFSRYLAKHPEGKDSLAAAAILPAVLVHDDSSEEVAKFAGWIRQKLDGVDEVVIDGVDLVTQWPSLNPDRLAKHEAASMAELLATLGVGLEPDVRFSGPIVGPGKAVLFYLGESPNAPGVAWTEASAILQMTATLIATSTSNQALFDRVVKQIQVAFQLDVGRQNRVRAHLLWGTLTKMSAATTKRSLADVDVETKTKIGDFLIDVAATSGDVGPIQMTALTTAFKILDLQPTTIYSMLHERSTQYATEPIEMRPATISPPGEAVPLEKKQLTADTLNQDIIQAKLAESARATALLGDIFADSNVDDLRDDLVPSGGVGTLSAALTKLAIELSRQTNWSNDDFAKISKECGLLPNGAVESLNDHAFDVAGEPVLEGGTTIKVNQLVLQELLA